MTQTIKKNITKYAKAAIAPQSIIITVTGIAALSARIDDIPLCFLAGVMVQLAQENQSKVFMMAVSLLFFGVKGITQPYYLPYFLFTAVYCACFIPLRENKIKPQYLAAEIFAIAKIYILTLGYDSFYLAFAIIEAWALTMLSPTIKESFTTSFDITQETPLLVKVGIFLIAALSYSGVWLFNINLGTSLMLCLALSFAEKKHTANALISLMCLYITVVDSEYFTYYFIGYLVIFLVGTYFCSYRWLIYPITAFFALMVSVVYLTRFNSFAFASTAAAALAMYFLVNRYHLIKSYCNPAVECDDTGCSELLEKITKLDNCFRFLGNTVTDISNLAVKEEMPIDMTQLVADEVCKSCSNNVYCWQQRYSDTQNQFDRYANQLKNAQQPLFEDWFNSSCIKKEKLSASFNKTYQLLTTKQLINKAGRQSQKLLQNQFSTMSDILREIRLQDRKTDRINTAASYQLTVFLNSCTIENEYCTCHQNPSMAKVKTLQPLSKGQVFKIRSKLESIYSCKFVETVQPHQDNGFLYTFIETPMFTEEFYHASKGYKGVCGDECQMFKADEYIYIILSDGMGTGCLAAAESKTAVSMAKSLLMSGVSMKTTLNIVNVALNLKGTGQSCASMDILKVNMYNGCCEMIKAGAGRSLVVHAGKVNVLYKDSLPLGILKDVSSAEFSFTLNNANMLIMLSDGAVVKDNHAKQIANMSNIKEIVDYIIENCCSNDDVTAAVFKINAL